YMFWLVDVMFPWLHSLYPPSGDEKDCSARSRHRSRERRRIHRAVGSSRRAVSKLGEAWGDVVALAGQREMIRRTAIKVYAKLPGWFTVPTPLGGYNLDSAVLI